MRIEQIEIEVMETDIILSQDYPMGDVPISISFPLVQWELVKTLIEDGIKDIGDKHGKG